MTSSIRLAAVIAFALAGGAMAASVPPSALPARTTPAASDIVVVTPVGSSQSDQMPLGGIGGVQGFVRNYPAGISCDGAHDDTTALQTAISAGARFDLPPGTCKFSHLTLTTAASDGLIVRGQGETAGDGSGASKTVLKPDGTVSPAISIDGTAGSIYIQGVRFEDLTLDLTSMAAGQKGFYQGQSYDIAYRNVRVRNDTGKTSWSFGPGAYTTLLDHVQGALVSCVGTGTNNPTTITLVNPDIDGLNVEQCASVTSIGGAIQPGWTGSNTIVYLPAGSTGLYGFGPIPASGIYLALGGYTLNAQQIETDDTDWEALSQPPATCAVTGWAYGTYTDGTHGCAPIVMAIEFNSTTKAARLSDAVFAGLYAYVAPGADVALPGYQPTSGGAGSFFASRQSFGGGIDLYNSGTIRLFSDFQKATQTGLWDSATGSINLYSGGITAAIGIFNGNVTAYNLGVTAQAIGNFISVLDAANHSEFGCYSGGTRASDSCFTNTLIGYQDDAGTVQKWSLSGQTGNAVFAGNVNAASYNAGSSAGVNCAAGTFNATTAVFTNGLLTKCN